ncbi:hypothetical protein BY996DRAFT_6428019 [Phakopsora pachyrhizi]|nr:hypothetical protein BY996DRAFT_6428019 [Phakopsora pachyrhizi]
MKNFTGSATRPNFYFLFLSNFTLKINKRYAFLKVFPHPNLAHSPYNFNAANPLFTSKKRQIIGCYKKKRGDYTARGSIRKRVGVADPGIYFMSGRYKEKDFPMSIYDAGGKVVYTVQKRTFTDKVSDGDIAWGFSLALKNGMDVIGVPNVKHPQCYHDTTYDTTAGSSFRVETRAGYTDRWRNRARTGKFYIEGIRVGSVSWGRPQKKKKKQSAFDWQDDVFKASKVKRILKIQLRSDGLDVSQVAALLIQIARRVAVCGY